MHLNPNIDINEFLKVVSTCKGDVLFETPEGDQMNLKSELCRFVFASGTNVHRTLSAEINCKNPEDVAILKDFLKD